MTRDKAKEIISYHKNLVDMDTSGLLDKQLEYQAIDIAIKALEQEPTPQNNLEVDAVSRAEVLKIFDEWFAICDIADKKASPKAKIKALPSVTPQEPRWIPTSERLPESDVDVLTQYSDYSMSVDFRTASSSGWFWADEELPVAWMPLPTPFEPQESEDNNAEVNLR